MKNVNSKSHIIIKGARVHNLKNIDVAIQRNKMTVITGVSGSGKSSLAFDTLYAEGQRRYVESLSAYARLFLGRLDKPDVDQIKGISPAIAIEQKVNTTNPRSTVGTSTEIYDFLKLLFARIGKTISPISGKQVKKDNPEDLLKTIKKYPPQTKLIITCPVVTPTGRKLSTQLKLIKDQGYNKLFIANEIVAIDDLKITSTLNDQELFLVVDRLSCATNKENISRIMESAVTAFSEGNGKCEIIIFNDKLEKHTFNNKFEENGIIFEEPSIDFFSFNNPIGACPTCEGYGSVMGIDPNLVIPNTQLSVYENGVVCWRGEKMSKWKDDLINSAHKFDFPIHQPINELNSKNHELLWQGNEHFNGINSFFSYIESKSYKIQYRVMLARYRGKTTCPDCKG